MKHKTVPLQDNIKTLAVSTLSFLVATWSGSFISAQHSWCQWT